MLGRVLRPISDIATLAETAKPAASLLRLWWAWAGLLAVGAVAALVLVIAVRRLRVHTVPGRPRPGRAPAPRIDAWSESAKRLRPDDPSAPREPGRQ